jgi:homoserine dehydrogenase
MNFCSRHPLSHCVHAIYRVYRRGERIRASHPRPADLQQALAEIGLKPGPDSIAISAGIRGVCDLCSEAAPREPLRVALLGHGTVGGGLYRRIVELPDHFTVTGIAVRDVRKAERAGAPARLLHDRCWRVLCKPADVVVELIGGTVRAPRVIAWSLKLGRHVVTANKAVIAPCAPQLEELARAHGVQLLYSASVGGALPALETLRRERGGVRCFSGVLNATSNYVLDSIAEGLAPREAVAAAQRAGYAEADPRLDLDGTDAAQKVTILARAAFGRDPARVSCEGISRLDPEQVRAARREGKAVRLVASCREDGVAQVRPELLPLDHPLAETRGAENRLFVERRDARPLLLSATGAGRWPTAEAVLADLYDLSAPREFA